MKTLYQLILLFLLVQTLFAEDICVGTLVSKAKKLETNSYCIEGFFYEIAARIAVKNLNDKEEYLKGHKLILDVRDIKRDRYETLELTREVIQSHLAENSTCPIAAIIGAASDEMNSLIQLTAEKFVVPQVSYESHRTDFANTRIYPYFVRLSASQDLIAMALLKLIEKYRWQRFNIIAPDNSEGSNAIEELKKAVSRMSPEFQEYITIGESIRYPSSMFLPLSQEDYDVVVGNLNTIKKTGNRINILYADPVQAAAFLFTASQHDMTGVGWVYIGTNWNTMQTYAGLAPDYQNTVREAMNGMVGISPFIGNVAALDESFSKYLNEHPELQEEAKSLCGQEIVIKKELYPQYMVFAYDAVTTIAKGIESVLAINPNATFFDESTRKELYEEILNVKFDGQSGRVQFKPGVGDRLPIKIEIVNIYDGQVIDIGDAEFQSVNDYRFEIDVVPKWSGGSTAIPSDRDDETEENLSLYIVVILFWMCLSYLLSALFEKWGIHRLPESACGLILGIIAGVIIHFSGSNLSSSAVYNPQMISLFLSPILVFDYGFNIKTRSVFFKNFGTILIYAIIGTIVNGLVTGSILAVLFNYGFFGDLKMSVIECLIFGALISCFNPNATLSVYNSVSVDPLLFTIVYGESSVNDVVSIVMSNSLSKFLITTMSAAGVFEAIGTFILMFVGSVLIGCTVALTSCLILKYNNFNSVSIEAVVIFLTAYLASELTETLGLSGITATLACGITLSYFGLQNLSKQSQVFTQSAVKVAASIANSLVYFLIGSNVLLTGNLRDVPWKLVLTVFLTSHIVRTIVIFTLSFFINMKRTKSKISIQSQIMIINSCLRGAISFALAINFPSHNQTIVTTVTMWIVVITVFLLGCSTYDMLHLLKIPLHCSYDTATHGGGRHKRSIMANDGSLASRFGLWVEKYVIPFFTKPESQLEEPLLFEEDSIHTPITPITPMESIRYSPAPSKHSLPSVTRVVKGQSGKTFVHNIADVEDAVLSDEQDDYIISDDEVDRALRSVSSSNMNANRLSFTSNRSKSPRSSCLF